MNILDALDEAERGPGPDDMADAPLIENWWIEDIMGALRARGDLSGHPTICDPHVTTSAIFGFNAAAGWMRTQSRFYRLGLPLAIDGMTIVDAVPPEVAQEILATARKVARQQIQ